MRTRFRHPFDLFRAASTAILAVVVMLFVTGCGDGETGPESLAFNDDAPIATTGAVSSDSQTDAQNWNPPEVTEGDLPVLLTERLNLMNEWLRENPASKSSGNGDISIGTGENGSASPFTIEMFIDMSNRVEAEALCPLYVGAARTYGGTKGQPAEITLSGWVMTDRGVFGNPGWDVITCDLS